MLRRVKAVWEYLAHRRPFEAELDEEIRSQFEMMVDRLRARGMSEAEARRAARIEFEGVEVVKENVRGAMAGNGIDTFFQDLRFGWRAFRRNPAFTAVTATTLALGIGVTAAIFSVFYGILLQPMPYEKPERLVRIWASFRDTAPARAPISGPMFVEAVRRQSAFTGIAAIWVVAPRTFAGDDPEQLKCAHVTANFFDVLGVRAAAGRTFSRTDTGSPAVMLTSGIFGRRFLGDRGILGKGLSTREGPAVLAGVLPATFELRFAPDANIPPDVQMFDVFGNGLERQSGRFLRLVARMKPGVSMRDAQADLDRISADIQRDLPQAANLGMQLKLAGLQEDAYGDVSGALRALFAGAACVLLIACVNVTSLLSARAADRRKEIALRLTLGASRARVLRQLLAEALLLCTIGGAGGVAVGTAVYRAILAIRPERLARLSESGLNWPVLGFAAATALVSAAVFACVPAAECFRLNLFDTLRASGRAWLSRLQRRAGEALVAIEVALGFVLVTGAFLAARSLTNIERVRPGFKAQGRLTFQVPVGFSPAARQGLIVWESDLASIPGVTAVGAISHLPLDHDLPNWYGSFRPAEMTKEAAERLIADYRAITPGYFSAMGVRLMEGRIFDWRDTQGAEPVAIVDETVAREGWKGKSPLGKSMDLEGEPVTVVGVVEHVRNHSMTEDVRGVLYRPVMQSPRSPLTFVAKTPLDPLSLVPAIRAKLKARDSARALGKIRPMAGYVEQAVAPAGFTALLAGIFGLLALILAATGIYGVLNYQVSRRLPEMGIRSALGAHAWNLLGMVLRESAVVVAAGMALGLLGAMLAGRWMSGVMFGVSPWDPMSILAAAVLVPLAALAGCWRPARRAAMSNAMEMIREE
jgi:predicted permease